MSQKTNSNKYETREVPVFDFVIVGAGAAGCVIAARIAEDPMVQIALIEAGGDYTKNPNIYTPAKHLLLWDAPVYQPPFDPDYDEWTFQTMGSDSQDNEYVYPRGTGYGGSTNHNSLVMLRGSRKPYDQWAKLSGDSSWNYDNLLPYFKKIENNGNCEVETQFRGKSGWLDVTKFQPEALEIDIIKAAMDMGLPYIQDTNGDPQNIAGVSQWDNCINRTTGRRSYAAVDLLLPIMKKNQNITIFDHSLATKILFDERGVASGLKANGVEFLQGKSYYSASIQFQQPETRKLKRIYARKEVIICGGAFNSPQLLMLSGIGPREHLQSLQIPVRLDLPVGNHLLDHMEVTVIHEVDTVYTKQICPNNNLPIIHELTRSDDSPVMTKKQQSGILSQLLGALAPITPFNWSDLTGVLPEDDVCTQIYNSSGLGPNAIGGHSIGIDWFPAGMTIDRSSPAIHIGSLPDYFKDFNLKEWMGEQNPLKTYHTFLIEVTQPYAKNGTVRLKSKNPLDTPIINERLDNDRDLSVLAGGIQFVRDLMKNTYLTQYQPNEIRPGSDYDTLEDLKTFIAQNSLFGHHCSGTVKFGHPLDPNAVLDPQLRVKGVTNLRVIDASVFPTIVSYNPNLPIYCIAEKMSDVIKQTWGLSSPNINLPRGICNDNWKMNNHARHALITYIRQYHPNLVIDHKNIQEFFNSELQKTENNQIIDLIVNNNGLVTLPIMLQWIENHHYRSLLHLDPSASQTKGMNRSPH